MCPRVRPVAGRLLALIGAIWLGPAGAATADPAPRPVLHLADGSYLPGNLRDSTDPKVLVWNSPAFARPLEFPLSAIQAVHYAAPAKPKQPTGEYCFELVDGDIIYGDLLALTDDEMEVNAAPLGRLHLQRDQVRRVSRRSGADSIYVGPNGLAGWTEPAAATDWRDEGGQLFTDRHGATLFGDLGIPEKAVIELDLSWKAKADFVLALAADGQNGRVAPTFRFEVWDGVLVVVGESTRDADMAILQEAGTRGGELRVQIYLDQQQRKLILVSRTGKILATLNIKGAKPQSHTGVQLTNGKGDVRLEHLRVTRWNGIPPRDVRDDQSRLHRADGSIVYGQLTAYNPESKQFTIHEGAGRYRGFARSGGRSVPCPFGFGEEVARCQIAANAARGQSGRLAVQRRAHARRGRTSDAKLPRRERGPAHAARRHPLSDSAAARRTGERGPERGSRRAIGDGRHQRERTVR